MHEIHKESIKIYEKPSLAHSLASGTSQVFGVCICCVGDGQLVFHPFLDVSVADWKDEYIL